MWAWCRLLHYYCEGHFDESTFLGYSLQLFSEMLIYISLWKYFVCVIKVHTQLPARVTIILHNLGGKIQMVEGLPSRVEAAWRRISLCGLQLLLSESEPSSLSACLLCGFSACPDSSHTHSASSLHYISLYISPTCPASLAEPLLSYQSGFLLIL